MVLEGPPGRGTDQFGELGIPERQRLQRRIKVKICRVNETEWHDRESGFQCEHETTRLIGEPPSPIRLLTVSTHDATDRMVFNQSLIRFHLVKC